MSAGKMLLGAVIGMATGAVLALLFAPNKGSLTRNKLTKQGSRYLGALENTASEYTDALGEKFESVKDAAVDITDRVKGAVDSLAGHEPAKHARRT